MWPTPKEGKGEAHWGFKGSFGKGALPSLALVLGDVVALEAALFLGYALRLLLRPLWPLELPPGMLGELSLGFALFPLGYALAGLYPGYGLGVVERLRRKVTVTFLLLLFLLAWGWMAQLTWARGVVLLSLPFTLALPPLVEAGLRGALVSRGLWGVTALVLGAGRTGRLVVKRLKKERGFGLLPVAFLDDDPGLWGQEVEGLPVLGGLGLAPELARKGFCWAVLAMPGAGPGRLAQLVQELPFPHMLFVPDLFGLPSLWVSTRDLGGVLALEVRKNLLLRRNRMVKRFLDYALGIPLTLLALPVIGVLALWVWRVSPGSPFYTQERIGYGGRPFRVIKLRTMYPDAEARLERYLEENPEARHEWERFFKLKRDPRVLPGVGHFLRRTSLDELPQLFNVLRGEMSLVGPRPFPRYHLDRFSEEFRILRQSVLPGLTGLWQVAARSEGDLEVQEALDTYYIRNWSLWLDLYILARTAWVVLKGKGAY